MTARSIRRAAERRKRKLLVKQNRALAMAARPDEPAVLSEAKVQENEPAVLSEAKVQENEPAVLSEAKIQENEPAERKAKKLARKSVQSPENASAPVSLSSETAASFTEIRDHIRAAALAQLDPFPETTPEPIHQISEAQLAANRANAKFSRGPTTSEGKGKSSLNAVKTGLTGRTVLLPSDDAAAYESHVAALFAAYQPMGDEEHNLVQSLADTEWRLARIPALEFGIYAMGRIEFANLFDDHDPALRPALIQAHTYLAYHRQLNNLSIQESRLRRQREKDTAALKQLQSERQAREITRPATAVAQLGSIQPNGFEFSIPEIPIAARAHIAAQPPQIYPDAVLSALRSQVNAQNGA